MNIGSTRQWMGLAIVGTASLITACTYSPAKTTAAGQLTIYLARHGQTEWNRLGRMQGWSDIPLNELGQSQAAALAARMSGVNLDRIYCSSLQRSQQTARALTGRAPIEVMDELRERSVGALEGIQLSRLPPEEARAIRQRFAVPHDDLDGGETDAAHLSRVQAALATIRRRHPSGAILIVGHGGTNAQILKTLLELSRAEVAAIHQANDELYRIEFCPDRPPQVWKLIAHDRLSEL